MIGDFLDGVVNFFKPVGMTSHDAVYFFRKLFGIKKIGHTGTLDPMAAGVLPICIGKATRIAEYISDANKEYIGEVTLGTRTDTLDSTGVPLVASSAIVCEAEILKAFDRFEGSIHQLPPMYSAKKINGRKLYDLARQGLTVERKPREVYIYEMEILNNFNNRKVLFRTLCSKGTYIRTICDDVGEALGTYGHMSFLLRTSVCGLKINQSYGMNILKELSSKELEKVIIPMDSALSNFPMVTVEPDRFVHLANGLASRVNSKYANYPKLKPLRIYAGDKFVGLGILSGEDKDLSVKMEKVLTK